MPAMLQKTIGNILRGSSTDQNQEQNSTHSFKRTCKYKNPHIPWYINGSIIIRHMTVDTFSNTLIMCPY